MTPSITIIIAILGFFSALALLASALLFLYVSREFLGILDWLREFTKMYLGVEINIDKKSPGAGFVKWDKMWNEDQDGKD